MKHKKKVSIGLSISVALSIFLFKYFNDNKLEKSTSLSNWNKKVDQIKEKSSKNSRSIASVKIKKKLDHRVKIISTYDNPNKKNDRKVNSVSLIKLAPGEKIEPDFGNAGVGYRFKDHHYAIKDTEENRKDYPDHIKKLNFLIVKSDTNIYNSLSVVVNTQTGREGIFTGVLKVKLTDIKYINDIVGHNNFQITQTYYHINVAHFLIEDVKLAVKTHKLLRSNPYVKRVSLEILEYARSHR